MPKSIIKGFLLILLAVFVTGCASSGKKVGGVTTRAYIAEKERVDQNMEGANRGYIMGTSPDRGDYKKTREVFVVEFTKETPEEDMGNLVPPARPKLEPRPAPASSVQEPEWAKPVAIPPVEEVQIERKAPAVQGACEEYTVQKGDTLQKISKKFYGSYAKWGRIYEANKDKMDDPDAIKVGMKLCVPGGSAAPAEEEVDNLK